MPTSLLLDALDAPVLQPLSIGGHVLFICGFAFLSGLVSALAGRGELWTSRSVLVMTRSFFAFGLYLLAVLLPVAFYFYFFYGAWFVSYVTDVRSLPSAVVLLGFVFELALGVAGFALGTIAVRLQRERLAASFAAGLVLLGGVTAVMLAPRWLVVGNHVEFQRQFGLVALQDSPLFFSIILMNTWVLGGFSFLVWRLWRFSTSV